MKKYLYIETGADGCGDLYVSLKPLIDEDTDESEYYREETFDSIGKDFYMGRHEDARVRILLEE